MPFQPRFLLAVLLCTAPMIHAEEETVAPVIVTASRVAESVDETLAAVTVIDRKEIERSQAQSLSDILRATPGVSLDVNGGRGKLVNLMLRGTNTKHVLILVDGIPIGSATAGQAALQDIPAAQIERIEVVRGPRSSLYGSEAIGGVVQIFTRRAEQGLNPNASVTMGSYGTRELSAGINGRQGATWFSVQGQGVRTDGFDVCPNCAEPDDDGYKSGSGSMRVGHRFENSLEAEFNALRSQSENEFDANYTGAPNESKSLVQVVGGRIGYDLADTWHAALTAGRSKDNSKNYADGVFVSRFDTVRDSASLQNDFSIAEHLTTLGFDYQTDRVDSTTNYNVDSRTNRGLFAQYRTRFGIHDLQLAMRGDDNEQFGFHRTGNIAWGVGINDNLRLTAGYGTAFKAPTFNDLYWPDAGNPDLQPETSASGEVGVQTSALGMHIDFRLFRTDVNHLINWACTANCTDADYYNDFWQPVNVGRARIDGAELSLWGEVAGWATRVALTLLDPRDEDTGKMLNRRARESGRLDADRQLGAYGFGATLVAEGDRYDDVANTKELPGYATFDLRGSYRLAKEWSVGARVENVFDQDYQTAADYAQPGRSYYLTIAYKP